MPRVMISGMHPEHADADAGQDAGQGRNDERHEQRNDEALATDQRGDDEPAHRRDGADGQVDAAGQERQGLAAGEERQGDRRPEDDAGPARADDLRADEEHQDDQDASRPISGMSGRSRNSARNPPAVSLESRAFPVPATPLMRGPAGAGSGCRP